ncbi:hypothetical protein IC608_03635 [Devosia sp. PTR5]|uniref:Uncharacterized protein n=2 Tax=Devosia oryzisoli TaxID=2774138 RepID=A0A927ISB8_9HYPH|nr:hypothetical protein [Devosia oryzisoli]
MEPGILDQMLRGGLLNAAVRAEMLDPRIVVMSDLDQSQFAELSMDSAATSPATTDRAPDRATRVAAW